MKRIATMCTLGVLLVGLTVPFVAAQPVRNGVDVIWARDVAGATMTLDGQLAEPEWALAEKIELKWNNPPGGKPGSGQKIEGNPQIAEPLDGNDGTLYLLRDGNVLWMGLDVRDKSIGGGRALQAGNWFFDGFIMAMTDRSERGLINYDDPNNFVTNPAEFIYGWWLPADTLEGGLPVPDIGPRFFGNYGVGFNDKRDAERTPEKEAVLNWAYSIDGVSNDDTHGDDVGYVFEVTIDLGLLGYDFSRPGGDKVPFSFALQDADYNWPFDENKFWVSRVWFQNQWANNFNEGAAYILGASDVTVNSGAAPDVTEPEFHIPTAGALGAPTLDGSLDEAVWQTAEPIFYMQYQAPPEVMDMNPGAIAPYYQMWFRPDINGDGNAALVVDPSLAQVKMFFEGNTLYIGVDVADQAVSGFSSEGGRDGIRFTMRHYAETDAEGTLTSRQIDVYIDSSGVAQFALDALTINSENPGAIQAMAHLKGASTVADPTDIDEGYQLEIAIDLTAALGYPDGLGDGRLWLSVNFFDGDFLENPADSYATRTWISGERAEGGSIYGYLNAASAVAVEDEPAGVPERITLLGNFPNPFHATTTLRYALPRAGEVTVQVFDVLGRQVAQLKPGRQGAGTQALAFDAAGFASGIYFYRVQVAEAAGGQVLSSSTGRMVLLK
ncbi:T9SS type A sorting domain-containing protein [Rhodocaloribacter litoris]|uniref:T9SS type A sorting domain-containing protein n=1 Tax=Rhodocaloribacter litoris TaxID=2558931 RepID=UPI0014231C33|nr:T9SS type A sorting domain-containing protein [Rhodocaloribacter litoris]QXD15145.1 T9SS type A sorting domain-containing protein [Rhodocaloribacter litoris]